MEKELGIDNVVYHGKAICVGDTVKSVVRKSNPLDPWNHGIISSLFFNEKKGTFSRAKIALASRKYRGGVIANPYHRKMIPCRLVLIEKNNYLRRK